MKKSNVIIFALLAVVSVFLLWLWYYLRLNLVDEPLDLVLSIVWWVVIAVAIGVIIKMEQTRRQRIRTVYVGEGATFNSEKGLMQFESVKPTNEIIASILDGLKYDFTRKDFPDKEDFEVKYFVRTKEFKTEDQQEDASVQGGTADQGTAQQEAQTAQAAQAPQATQAAQATQELPTQDQASESEQKKWKGEVVVVDTQEEIPFDTPEELADILAKLDQAA